MIDEYFWIAAQFLIAACFGIGTALIATRSKKEVRQQLDSEIKVLERSLNGMHREAAILREETATLRKIKEDGDQIRKEYASLADRKAALEDWAREEVRRLDEIEAKRRAANASDADLSRLKDELGTLRAIKAKLEGEVEDARTNLEKTKEAKDKLDDSRNKLLATEAALDLAKERLNETKSALETAKSNAKRAKKEQARAAAAADAAAEQADKVSADLLQIQEEFEQAHSDHAALKRENEDLRIRNETVASKNNELEMEELSLKGRRDALKDEIAQLLQQIASGSGETQSDNPNRLGNLERPPVLMHPKDGRHAARMEEHEKLEHVIEAIRNQGLRFRDRIVHRFHTALKVSRISPLTVLAGISGTGKTQLPREYAKAIGMECLIVPVQPRWDGPRDLLGHFDFLHRRFQATDLARLMYDYTHIERSKDKTGKYRLARDDDRMLIVLLDEMNLARTEYYFSEFLSRLELQDQKDEKVGAEIDKERMVELDIPYVEEMDAVRVFPTQRILWVGTMNEDESTMTLSDKVIDRSNILRFARPTDMNRTDAQVNEKGTHEYMSDGYLSAKDWNMWCAEEKPLGETLKLIEHVNQEIMDPCGRSFGHRMSNAMVQYVKAYTGRGWQEGFCDQIEMRLLPKLQGVDAHIESAGDAMSRLAKLCEEDLNDEELASSIQKSQAEMHETGTFNWTGRELP